MSHGCNNKSFVDSLQEAGSISEFSESKFSQNLLRLITTYRMFGNKQSEILRGEKKEITFGFSGLNERFPSRFSLTKICLSFNAAGVYGNVLDLVQYRGGVKLTRDMPFLDRFK